MLQECYVRKNYLSFEPGVLPEVTSLITLAALFTGFLILWEYKLVQLWWTYIMSKWIFPGSIKDDAKSVGVLREKEQVLEKAEQLKAQEKSKKSKYCKYRHFKDYNMLVCSVVPITYFITL